jgi:hypothetical protein
MYPIEYQTMSPPTPGDDEHERARERVEEDLQLHLEVARGEPRVGGRDLLAVGRIGGPEAEERDERSGERDERREDGDPRGGAPRDATACERDRDRSGERRQQAHPGAGLHHPRSALA